MCYVLYADTCFNPPREQSCEIVEGKITLLVQGSNTDEQEEESLVSKAYTAVMLMFHSLDNNEQGMGRVSYIGSNPVSLSPVDKLSKRQDMNTATDISNVGAGIFTTIFLVVSVCGCLGAVAVLVMYLRSLADKSERHLYDEESQYDEEKSSGIPNTIAITISSSSSSDDDLGCDDLGQSLTDHTDHPIEAQEQESDWSKLVYLESLALSLPSSAVLTRVPEETSVDYGYADERSI